MCVADCTEGGRDLVSGAFKGKEDEHSNVYCM